MISEDPRLPLPIELKRYRRSRRLRLRLDHGRRVLTLTMPWRASARKALDWAASQRDWIDRQLGSAPPVVALADGATLLFEGRETVVRHDPAARRGVVAGEGVLHVGGPADTMGPTLLRWLKARARDRLSAETARVAALAGVTVRQVSIGDATGRWGSCSSSGAIRYSWRLVLAPPEVLRFVVAHEVAHRLHMDHGPDFKRAEARLFGGPVAAARSELRRLGPALRGVGGG